MERRKRRFAIEDSETEELKVHTNWAISYADMVTLLLCFFIMFFNTDTKEEASPQRSKLLLSIAEEFQNYTKPSQEASQPATASKATGKGDAPADAGKLVEEGKGDSQHAKDFAVILNQFKAMPNAVVSQTQDHLELQIANVEFFARGSTKLSAVGKKNVELVHSVVKPYREKIYIEIIGHTDSEPVSKELSKRGRRRFTTNLELSTFRAMDVLSHLQTLGVQMENMVIAGYSDSLLNALDEKSLKANSSTQRRVSFRIRLKP